MWSEDPIDSRWYADIVDLFVGETERSGGCLAFIVLDADDRLRSPLILGDVPGDAEPRQVLRFLDHLRDTLRTAGGSTLFVRGRPGKPFFTDADRSWHQGVIDQLGTERFGTDAFVRDGEGLLRGAYLATPGVVRPFPPALSISDLAS